MDGYLYSINSNYFRLQITTFSFRFDMVSKLLLFIFAHVELLALISLIMQMVILVLLLSVTTTLSLDMYAAVYYCNEIRHSRFSMSLIIFHLDRIIIHLQTYAYVAVQLFISALVIHHWLVNITIQWESRTTEFKMVNKWKHCNMYQLNILWYIWWLRFMLYYVYTEFYSYYIHIHLCNVKSKSTLVFVYRLVYVCIV